MGKYTNILEKTFLRRKLIDSEPCRRGADCQGGGEVHKMILTEVNFVLPPLKRPKRPLREINSIEI